jgi:hypothetical protein
MISQGAADKQKLRLRDLQALKTYFATALNAVLAKIGGGAFLSFSHHGLDERGFDKLRRHLSSPAADGLTVLWLPAADGFTHANGAGRQEKFFGRIPGWLGRWTGHFDVDLGRALDLAFREDTLVVLTADHGHYDADPDHRVTAAALYGYLAAAPGLAGEGWPLTRGRLDENVTGASAVLSLNGGSAAVSVRGENGWGDRPGIDRLRPFLERLSEHPAVELVFYRTGETYRWWRAGEGRDPAELPQDLYPAAARRLAGLAASGRAADIVLSARAPWAFAPERYRGQHGRLNAEDSLVPLFFIHPALDGRRVDREVHTVDLAPTLAHWGAAPSALQRTHDYVDERRRKMDQLLETLEAHLRSSVYQMVPRRSRWRLWGRYPRAEIKKDWSTIERELRENIARKLGNYRVRGLWDSDTLADYQARLRRICELYSKEGPTE